jgi:hypothetical protein
MKLPKILHTLEAAGNARSGQEVQGRIIMTKSFVRQSYSAIMDV